MKHPTLRFGLAACALLLMLGGTAHAQYAFDDEIMPPRAVVWRLADRGFTGIARPRFDGRAYVVEAFAPNGARMRLFVDAADGAILGRQRLDAPPTALARPVPGFGWTEEDEAPRRAFRQAERFAPPADIPMPGERGVPLRRDRDPEAGPIRPDDAIGSQGRAASEPNPHGLNPDARGRSETPRKIARIGTPAKVPDAKAPQRAGPDAPRLRPAEAAQPAVKPEAPVAAVETSRPASPTATPAAVQPPSDGSVASSAETPAAATSGKSAVQSWKDPQPEGKRNVRVIGGATVVPGTAEKEPGAAP
ncbi:hypothetical protein [uncultured Methylobacterium sp.]|uniref:hypothetical protein n=1 Tax=uncultured Methylobacterium sp. TaxID=157278 RepID=UPI0035C99673